MDSEPFARLHDRLYRCAFKPMQLRSIVPFTGTAPPVLAAPKIDNLLRFGAPLQDVGFNLVIRHKGIGAELFPGIDPAAIAAR
jgi:hypothetical protein